METFIDLDIQDELDAQLVAQAVVEEVNTEGAPFPLISLLYLFIHGDRELVLMNYYKGFKKLHAWLSPIAIPTEQERPDLYRRLPWYLGNWEVQELAQILKCPQCVVWHLLVEIYNSGDMGER